MIRLFKIFIRPLLEYGHITTITASTSALKPWETIQTKYIRYILHIPFISNITLRKYAYLPTIKDRLNKLTINWYKNIHKNNNTPIINFINTHVKNFHKMDKHNSPIKIIENLLTQ